MLALVTALAAAQQAELGTSCASWCSRWTCGNTNFCGGCTAQVCQGGSPHPMCSDPAQPHCDAPRCEAWCSGPHSHCGRIECDCPFCSHVSTRGGGGQQPSQQASQQEQQPAQQGAPEASPSPMTVEEEDNARRLFPLPQPARRELSETACDSGYLRQLTAELRSMVEGQKAKNAALQSSLYPGGAFPSLPPAGPHIPPLPPSPPSPAPPPPPPCAALHQQCGGSGHTGPTTCCAASHGEPTTSCKFYNEWYSGCRHEGDM